MYNMVMSDGENVSHGNVCVEENVSHGNVCDGERMYNMVMSVERMYHMVMSVMKSKCIT
jgi:hypothetical protein